MMHHYICLFILWGFYRGFKVMFSSLKHKVDIQFQKHFILDLCFFWGTKHHLSSLIIWCKKWSLMLLNHLGLHIWWCNNWCLMVVDVIEHHWMFDEVEGEQNYHSHCWKFISMTQIILQFVDKQIVNVAPIKCQRLLFQTLICWIVL